MQAKTHTLSNHFWCLGSTSPHRTLAFPVTHLPMQSAAVPLSLLAKGIFCTSLSFLVSFMKWCLFLLYMLVLENFLSFFTSVLNVSGIRYN